jgi:hypothetical protein
MAVNMLVSRSISGYNLLRRMLPLPSPSTILRLLKAHKTNPGLNKQNISMMKLKVNPQSEQDKFLFILMDEMSLRRGLSYRSETKKIFGYEDNGSERRRAFV